SHPNTQLDFMTTSTSQSYFRASVLKAASKCPACDPPARTMVAVGLSGASSSSHTVIASESGFSPIFWAQLCCKYSCLNSLASAGAGNGSVSGDCSALKYWAAPG